MLKKSVLSFDILHLKLNFELYGNDIKKIHPNDLEKIVNDRDLYIDLKFASELIK